ncbi:MAG: hypothetical protein F9B45_29160 [Phycisphaera sp. RhM]|nr:hypothetical protein [Phycisphaera sp. RhM]
MTLRDLQAVEASVCAAHGIPEDVQAEYYARIGLGEISDEILNDANSAKFSKRQSLCDLLATMVEAANPSYDGRWQISQLLQESQRLDREIKASGSGTSTMSLSGIISNVANKSLLTGFSDAPKVMRQLAKVDSQSNYHERKFYRAELSGDFFGAVGASGEIKHGTLVETGYSVRPIQHGKQLGFSEEDMLADDLSVLTGAGIMLGDEAARRVEFELSALLCEAMADVGSGNFFDSAVNYINGSTTALSIDSISTADGLLAAMTNSQGDPISMNPTHLLVSGSNRATALQIRNSTEVRNASATGREPVGNPYQNEFDVMNSNWLLSGRHANPCAPESWFLASVSRMSAPLLLQFVGSDVPTVRNFANDPQRLGVTMRATLPFGVALFEPKSIIASKGKA